MSIAILFLAGVCAAQSSSQGGLQTTPSTQQPLLPLAAFPSCEQNATFCVPPSTLNVCSGTTPAPQQTQFFAFCFDPSTGQPLPGVTIQISVKAEDGTGAHLHTDPNRPAGDFNPSSGLVSSANNLLATMYTSPDVSGIIDATISGTLSDGVTPCTPATYQIGVETQGLAAIPFSGSGYTTVPSTGHDNSNVYANPSVATNLQNMPVSFDTLVQALMTAGLVPPQTIPTLTYTSISLTYGGLFDVDQLNTGTITNPWNPPHCGHRLGTNADLRIRNVPAQLRPALIQSILDSHFTMPVRAENPSNPTATHWHLKAN
jgi:hypothetical protein